ncbi:SDR family NAD(P)-dependent oxidoreductase [Sphingopyxis granuli]|nr:SDR family oxidoreductase [Sphingopyxis granuli]
MAGALTAGGGMGPRLAGRVCVVTGSGQGMGRASAIAMAREGAKVVVADINAHSGNETVAMIEAEGGTAKFIAVDLRNSASIQPLMDQAAATFGGIDVVHANAAVHETDLTSETSIEDLDEAVWDMVHDINLKAVWLCTKFAVPYLKGSKAPASVNVASTGALVSYPMAGAYCASKGGVAMLTKASATDLAKYGIRVNCYCPGAIRTPMLQNYIDAADDGAAVEASLRGAHLLPRLGEPEEVAKLAVFLASDDASFITGAAYLIDGGALAWRGQAA